MAVGHCGHHGQLAVLPVAQHFEVVIVLAPVRLLLMEANPALG